MFSLSFSVGKMTFYHCWPLWKNPFRHPLQKSSTVPLENILPTNMIVGVVFPPKKYKHLATQFVFLSDVIV